MEISWELIDPIAHLPSALTASCGRSVTEVGLELSEPCQQTREEKSTNGWPEPKNRGKYKTPQNGWWKSWFQTLLKFIIWVVFPLFLVQHPNHPPNLATISSDAWGTSTASRTSASGSGEGTFSWDFFSENTSASWVVSNNYGTPKSSILIGFSGFPLFSPSIFGGKIPLFLEAPIL